MNKLAVAGWTSAGVASALRACREWRDEGHHKTTSPRPLVFVMVITALEQRAELQRVRTRSRTRRGSGTNAAWGSPRCPRAPERVRATAALRRRRPPAHRASSARDRRRKSSSPHSWPARAPRRDTDVEGRRHRRCQSAAPKAGPAAELFELILHDVPATPRFAHPDVANVAAHSLTQWRARIQDLRSRFPLRRTAPRRA